MQIYNPTVIIRDGSIVSVGASHFGDKDQAEKYYGVVIRLVEAGKCARVKWNVKTVLCQLRTLMIWFWKKKFQKRKSLSYKKSLRFEFNPQILNGQVTSNFKQYLFQMSLQLQVTLLLDKLSLINTFWSITLLSSLSL